MISVIIPTWNEANHLRATLAAVEANTFAHEVLVVDASSEDGTVEVAGESGARVIVATRRQRASQLNSGADNANGDLLLFLHADTILPGGALENIQKAIESGAVGGAFARRFDSPSYFLRITCLLAEVRNRVIGWHLGDQAIFVRREVFQRLGGFRLMDRFEDLDFSRRMRRVGRIVTLRPPVITSARRFEREGPLARTMRDFVLTMRYLLGHPITMNPVRARDKKEHA